MSIEAGAICLFNCDQNGRDLPDDNDFNMDCDGNISYTCKCPYHYFLVLSLKSDNDHITRDWSRLKMSSENDRKRQIKLCSAVPIDIVKDDKNSHIYTFNIDEDFIENENNMRSHSLIKQFTSNGTNAVLCNQVCKININQLKEQTIPFFISSEAFKGVIEEINRYFEKGYKYRKKMEENINQ